MYAHTNLKGKVSHDLYILKTDYEFVICITSQQHLPCPKKICPSHILTIYAPVIYTAPCIMFWMGAYTLRGGSGRGLGPGIPEFFGPQMELAYRLVPKSQVHRLFYAHEPPGDFNAV